METTIAPRDQSVAFGAPGASPSWQRGDKDGVGTSYSASSRLWFTIWNGIVTEVYAPTVDRPQIRDLQFLFYDEDSHVIPEIEMNTSIETIDNSLGYRIRGENGGELPFTFEKEVICDPHRSCLLVHLKIDAAREVLDRLYACVLCAPHLATSGMGNNAQVINFIGKEVLVAEHNGSWLALAVDGHFRKAAVGYVGSSDAWTDLQQHHALTWLFKSAPNGNVALAGEVDLSQRREFTVFLSFGQSQHSTLANLLQSAALPYAESRGRFLEQWSRIQDNFEDLAGVTGDGGALYGSSVRLLLAHEDKYYPGAMVASLAIPWGDARGDDNGNGGYHLIWTRDLVQSALGLLAAGQTETPLRAFLYLAASQEENGRFPQNFWVNGAPYWHGLQLDEIAFPLILAHRLWKLGVVSLEFIEESAIRAVSFLILAGPTTGQERWEESGGISPSTLAAVITGIICAAEMAEGAGRPDEQKFLESYADWLESHLEEWTVTRSSRLVEGVQEHYVRINPATLGEAPPESVDSMQVTLNNIPPGKQHTFPAKEIIDAGFLELVRYGLRRPDDPTIVSSLRVVDELLRVETPSGVMWRRYNHDGYGQQADGSSYVTFGQGRGWPLLVGERGHYELAAQGSASDYIHWMEGFATPTHLLPEQSWDEADTADGRQKLGRPTGSAVPLLWAHAEYVKLARSQRDKKVFDRNERVEARYSKGTRPATGKHFWSFACPIASAPAGAILCITAEADFELVFSRDEWATTQSETSKRTNLRVSFIEVELPTNLTSELKFTFRWTSNGNWEGGNFVVRAS